MDTIMIWLTDPLSLAVIGLMFGLCAFIGVCLLKRDLDTLEEKVTRIDKRMMGRS